jgi:hypothetical protein
VRRTYDREVTPVERRELLLTAHHGRSEHRRVDESKRQLPVTIDEVAGP